MAWLRIDDGFAAHPKVTALSLADRWRWLAILCYCARYQTDGYLPDNIAEHVRGATGAYLRRLVELGLLDEEPEGLRVHDWGQYSPRDPTKAERMARWRRKRLSTEVSTEVSTQASTAPSTSPSTTRARPRARSRPVLRRDIQVQTSNGYVCPDLHKLLAALTDSDPRTEATIRRLVERYYLTEADVAWALESAAGPGVESPTRVAVAELRKRGEARGGAVSTLAEHAEVPE